MDRVPLKERHGREGSHLLRRWRGPFPRLRAHKCRFPSAAGPLASLPELQETVVFVGKMLWATLLPAVL